MPSPTTTDGRSPYCGRVDQHVPHEWLGRDTYPGPVLVRECPGAPIVEGGHPHGHPTTRGDS